VTNLLLNTFEEKLIAFVRILQLYGCSEKTTDENKTNVTVKRRKTRKHKSK